MNKDIKKIAKLWRTSLKEVDKKDWPAINEAFLKVFVQKGLISSLPKILKEIKIEGYGGNDTETILVRSPYDIDKKSIENLIKSKFDLQDFNIEMILDKTVLGGVRIEGREKILDLSLNHQLARLKESITK